MNEDQVMELEDLRLAVYRSFAATGQSPGTATLAEQLGTNTAEINSGLEMLRQAGADAIGVDYDASALSDVRRGQPAAGLRQRDPDQPDLEQGLRANAGQSGLGGRCKTPRERSAPKKVSEARKFIP